jgi:hypothetical protein
MMAGMRALLAAVCFVTIAASAWLATMFFVLHRAGYIRGVALAAFFVLESLLTLGVLNGMLAFARARVVTLAGGLGLILAGITAVSANLSSSHFEGYAVAIGAALVVQGALTLGLFLSGGLSPSAKMHGFGN